MRRDLDRGGRHGPHRAHACLCGRCGAETRANFPDGVTAPVRCGARLAAVVYLLHYQLLPEKRLAALMADLFGVHLVTATIRAMSRTCAARFQSFAAAVRDRVAAAPVKHMDETGFRIGGKTHWKPNYTLKGVLHALCNAHHLREPQALIERSYDVILTEGFAFHETQPALISTARKRKGRVPRRTGHNLLRRLRGRKLDVLRFLSDPTVPFTNNLSERDGRMLEPRSGSRLRQTISGGFRSYEGAEDFAVIRSLLSTARKQGWDILQAPASRSDRLIAEIQTA